MSFSFSLQAQRKEQPLGWVTSASPVGATITPAGGKLPLRARPGDFLFEGDTLAASRGEIRFLWCGKPPEGLLYEMRNGVIVIGPAPPKASSTKASGECLLPALERRPEVATLPARTKLEQALSGSRPMVAGAPSDPQSRLASAVRLQQSGRSREAAAMYLDLAKTWENSPRLLRLAQDLLAGGVVIPSSVGPPPEEGAIRALVIGISNYEQKGIDNLQFADRDAEYFAAYLRTDRGGSRDVVLLRDQQARIGAIRNHWLDLLSRTGEKDTLVLFIAGHGVMENGIPRVVTYRANPQEKTINALPLTEIQKFMSGEKASFREARVFLDVCHSGEVALLQPPARRSQGSRKNPAAARIDATPRFFGLTATHQGPDAFAYEDEIFDRHGVFTYFLLRGLHSRDASQQQRILTSASLGQYVMERVKAATNSEQVPTIALGRDAKAEIADFGKPGLPAFDTTPYDRLRMPPDKLQRKIGRRGRRDKPPGPQPEIEGGPSELDQRIALEDRGESILLRYLEGDEIPQQESEFRECAGIFQRALALQPGAPYLEARREFCLGRALVFARAYGQAIRRLENAIRLDPTAAYAYNALGIAYLERGEYATARLAFLDAIQRAPKWVYPLHNLALTYSEDGNLEMAVRTYNAAMKLAPDSFYLPYNLGLIQQRANLRREAGENFEAAIGKARLRAEPLTALGQLKAEQGDRTTALRYLRKAAGMGGQTAQALLAARHNLAVLLAADPATRDEAIRLWRGNECHLPSLMSLGETLESMNLDQEAIGAYRQILGDYPDHISARLKLAGLLDKAGRRDAAIAELRTALAVMPESPVILEALGGVYARAGRLGEARQAYTRARDLTADGEARKRIRKALGALEERKP